MNCRLKLLQIQNSNLYQSINDKNNRNNLKTFSLTLHSPLAASTVSRSRGSGDRSRFRLDSFLCFFVEAPIVDLKLECFSEQKNIYLNNKLELCLSIEDIIYTTVENSSVTVITTQNKRFVFKRLLSSEPSELVQKKTDERWLRSKFFFFFFF